MKVARTILRTGFVGLASLVGLAFCGLVAAQAPAGPVPAPPPGAVPAAKAPEPRPLPAARQSILGDWVLNRDESDDPRRHMRDDEDSNGGYGGRRPGGWPGGGGAPVGMIDIDEITIGRGPALARCVPEMVITARVMTSSTKWSSSGSTPYSRNT